MLQRTRMTTTTFATRILRPRHARGGERGGAYPFFPYLPCTYCSSLFLPASELHHHFLFALELTPQIPEVKLALVLEAEKQFASADTDGSGTLDAKGLPASFVGKARKECG